ncbi:hypothetical protein [Pantoea agglomerans]|uniref:hypothetical protein n=1 Tax=Enterobacter agglomerans TaxID=549 RepID=UPI003FD06B90
MTSDNPASRLYEILTLARNVPANESQREAWRQALHMNNCTDSQLLAQLGKVFALPEEIGCWLDEKFPRKQWTTWRTSVDTGFSHTYLDGSWDMVRSHINERAMTELDLISTLYETSEAVEPISQEELDSFTNKINEIKREIIDSDLSLQMKKTFLKYLNKILNALESYYITGSEPIIDAVEAAMGHVVVDSAYADSLKQTGTGEKLVSFLGSLIDAVASVQGLPPMATPFLQLIKSK